VVLVLGQEVQELLVEGLALVRLDGQGQREKQQLLGKV
jgi:hypothetical protein